MTDHIYRLVYLSRNDIAGGEDSVQSEIASILDSSRTNNARDAITGALMFNAGCFAQVLEGPHEAIQTAFERIQCDMRHSRVTILSFDTRDSRAFSDWAMAYVGDPNDADPALDGLFENDEFDSRLPQGDTIYDVLKRNLQERQRF